MEGSMKMMSWSRYHCLSKSLLRAGRRHRAANRVPHPRPPTPRAGWAVTRYCLFVIRLFRT
jgi:hypothetical protein